VFSLRWISCNRIVMLLDILAFSSGLHPDLKLVPAGGHLAPLGVFSRFAWYFFSLHSTFD
jgi:hypothetical protein